MVANINKLKGKIAENNHTMKSLSKEMGMSEKTLSKKINDVNADFYVGESWQLKRILNLSIDEYLNIFYDENIN